MRTVGAFTLVPLVCQQLRLICELDILLLRSEEPGNIITQAGDIDNRLKTLLDSLRCPHNPNEIPAGVAPAPDETPFHCLLEDDNLITHLSVTTDRLLRPAGNNEVELVLAVRIKPTIMTRANGFLVG